MNIEHVAFNVADPVGMARWWAEHLGMRVVLKGGPPQHAHFLADSAGASMVELYHNPAAPVPDYAAMKSATLHLAFVADDVPAAVARLLAAGAKPDGDLLRTDAGDEIAVVRDPWGFPVQLAHRVKPLL